MIKYRPLVDLTNDEITEIISNIFEVEKITDIKRHKSNNTITLKIWEWYEGDEESGEKDFLLDDDITLYEPYTNSDGDAIESYNADFSKDTILNWIKFCVAKGCFWAFKDNQYLK